MNSIYQTTQANNPPDDIDLVNFQFPRRDKKLRWRCLLASKLNDDPKHAERMRACGEIARILRADGTIDLMSLHCHVPFCPRCAERAASRQYCRMKKVFDEMSGSSYKFVFLTLTQRNCAAEKLRDTLKKMNKAYSEMLRENFSIAGSFRTTEVTRGADGSAHPHIHAILVVSGSYFRSGYWSHDEWCQRWQRKLKLDYRPVVDVRRIRDAVNALSEVIKYQIKFSDMTSDRRWYNTVREEMIGMRRFSSTGVVRAILSDNEKMRKGPTWERIDGGFEDGRPVSDDLSAFEFLKEGESIDFEWSEEKNDYVAIAFNRQGERRPSLFAKRRKRKKVRLR